MRESANLTRALLGLTPRMRSVALTLVAVLAAPLLSAQDFRPAPASIADSFVEISSRASVFSNYHLILLRADGTFQEIANSGVINSSIGFQTSPTAQGTYTYSTSPGPTGTEGLITFSTALITYRSTPDLIAIAFGGGSGGIDSPTVNVYPRLAVTGAVNVSNNSWISAAHPTTPGFVIQGTNPRWVLIRGDGPSLAQFGVPSPVSNPLMAFSGTVERSVNLSTDAQNDVDSVMPATSTVSPWASDPNLTEGFKAIFSVMGAFSFPDGSSDCAALVLLEPGAYTLQGKTSGADGELLTEVYVLPYGT